MLEAAILTGIGACWILSRFNLRRVAGYAAFWDVAISGLLAFLFVGTIRKTAGYEQVRFVREDGEIVAKPRWKRIK
jgi:hypothetical protein